MKIFIVSRTHCGDITFGATLLLKNLRFLALFLRCNPFQVFEWCSKARNIVVRILLELAAFEIPCYTSTISRVENLNGDNNSYDDDDNNNNNNNNNSDNNNKDNNNYNKK